MLSIYAFVNGTFAVCENLVFISFKGHINPFLVNKAFMSSNTMQIIVSMTIKWLRTA